jgi:hypothetical protein
MWLWHLHANGSTHRNDLDDDMLIDDIQYSHISEGTSTAGVRQILIASDGSLGQDEAEDREPFLYLLVHEVNGPARRDVTLKDMARLKLNTSLTNINPSICIYGDAWIVAADQDTRELCDLSYDPRPALRCIQWGASGNEPMWPNDLMRESLNQEIRAFEDDSALIVDIIAHIAELQLDAPDSL